MSEASLLAAAWMLALVGQATWALSIEEHWQNTTGNTSSLRPELAWTLRLLGTGALVASLWLCLMADHPSMAALVWVMCLSTGALTVAMTLAWRSLGLASGRRSAAPKDAVQSHAEKHRDPSNFSDPE